MALPTWVASNEDKDQRSAGILTLPPGWAEGDLLILIGCNATTAHSPGAGWTVLKTYTDIYNPVTVWWKFAGAAEPNVATTGTAGIITTWLLAAFRGASSIRETAYDSEIASTGVAVGPLTAQVDEMLVGLFGTVYNQGGNPNSGTDPATQGMTFRVRVNSDLAPPYGQHAAIYTQDYTAAGTTGTRTYSVAASNEQTFGALLLLHGNVPPNAPLLTGPVGGQVVNLAQAQRFNWTFSDDDAVDTQSQYDLQYRVVGAPSWTLLAAVATPNTYHDFAPNTFTANDYEWQVRTYDALGEVGPWSVSSYFTAASTPGAPTITAPMSGATVPSNAGTVDWSVVTQDSYQVRKVADAAGVADTATVYYDSGEAVSADARSAALTYPVNGRWEHLQVRVSDTGLWSDWASIRVLVSYTPPAVPTLTAVAVKTIAAPGDFTDAITVTVTNPAPAAGEPTVTSVDIYRREGASGDGLRIAAGLPAGAPWMDYTPASGVDYEYRATVHGDNSTSTASPWSGGTP